MILGAPRFNFVSGGTVSLAYSIERYHLAPALLRRIRRLWFRFGRSRFHEAADLFRRTSLHIVGNVRIGVDEIY